MVAMVLIFLRVRTVSCISMFLFQLGVKTFFDLDLTSDPNFADNFESLGKLQWEKVTMKL